MAVTLEALRKGHQFPSAAFALSPGWVAQYIASVEDEAIAALPGFVPPMGLAALSLRSLLESATLPADAIHLGQELAFLRAVQIGEQLTARAQITSRGERQGWVLMGVELAVLDESANPTMTGRATVTFPLRASTAPPVTASSASDGRSIATTGQDAIHAVVKEITQEKINLYADAGGDHNPLHVDVPFAAGTRFGGTIAHGMLVLAYASEMLTSEFGAAWLDTGRLKVRFRAPARPGDKVGASGRIASRGDGVTRCDVECRNHKGDVLIAGEAEVRA